MRPTTLLLATGLLLTAFVVPSAGADDGTAHDCSSGSYATISGASAGGTVLQLNGNSFEIGRKLLALTVSGDGYVNVDVTYHCVRQYHFTAEKTGLTGTVTTVDDWQSPACASGTKTYALPVGLDVVDYHMELDWVGCDGTSGHEERDIKVVDPPVTGALP